MGSAENLSSFHRLTTFLTLTEATQKCHKCWHHADLQQGRPTQHFRAASVFAVRAVLCGHSKICGGYPQVVAIKNVSGHFPQLKSLIYFNSKQQTTPKNLNPVNWFLVKTLLSLVIIVPPKINPIKVITGDLKQYLSLYMKQLILLATGNPVH